MAKTPDDGLSTVQKWQNLWLDAEIECRKLKECVKTLKLTTFDMKSHLLERSGLNDAAVK